MNIRNESAKAIGQEASDIKDRIFTDALTMILGSNWTLKSLSGRVQSVQKLGWKVETFLLDGIPFLEIHEPIFATTYADGSTKVTTTINYQRLKYEPQK